MRILALTHRLPFAPNRGDRIRAFHILRLLAAHGDVHVVSLVHDRAEQAEADSMRRMGVRVSTAMVPRMRNLMRAAAALTSQVPLTHVLLDSPALPAVLERVVTDWQPSVVFAYCSGVVPLCLAPPLNALPLVVDLVDVDSAKWLAFGEDAAFPRSWVFTREAKYLSAFERRAVSAASAVTVVNDRERDVLQRLCPGAVIHVVPNGVDLEGLTPPGPPSDEERVVFSAVFDYTPNADGAVWFARHVWPLVRAARPHALLTLAGSSPTRAVRQLAANDGSIEVTGSVPDMRPYLWRSAVAVAPIFRARGVQNKVLEAVAAGLPAVVTDAVRAGLPNELSPACRVADNPGQFAAAVTELLSWTPEARQRAVSRVPMAGLGWARRLAPLLPLLEHAAGDRTVVTCARG